MAEAPFLWLTELPEQSLQRSSPKALPGRILTPDTSQGQVLQPRPAGTGRILSCGMLLGVLALPSFPAQLQGQIPQCCSSALDAVP